MKFKKRPLVIEAVELQWENWDELCEFITLPWGEDGVHGIYQRNGVETSDTGADLGLIFPTVDGVMMATQGDFIIKGIKGEFYPCKPDVFEATYELV